MICLRLIYLKLSVDSLASMGMSWKGDTRLPAASLKNILLSGEFLEPRSTVVTPAIALLCNVMSIVDHYYTKLHIHYHYH